MFADRLIGEIKKKGSSVCVGLDPVLEKIPHFIKDKFTKELGYTLEAAAQAILEFNKGIIDSIMDVVPCVKPQVAFYEQYGFEGMWAYESTIDYAKEKGLIVIADAKRNDIGSTAEAYANAYLGQIDLFGGKYFTIDSDALTVTPFLGSDGIMPFVKKCAEFDKGVFVLVKTSNHSSGDFQDRMIDGANLHMYEMMAQFVDSWGADLIGNFGYSSVGAVVGATYTRECEKLREIMPNTIFLVPGYGAQGGTAKDVATAFNKDGLGAIINSSRAVIYAFENMEIDEKGYAEAARTVAEKMRDDINSVIV